MDIIANADWIIDLGPGGCDEGGRVVAVGPPDAIARASHSRTSPYLARKLRFDCRGVEDRVRRMIAEVRPFPSAAELIRDLSNAGLGVGLATSAPEKHLKHMIQLLGIADVVDFATNSDDVSKAKPDPEIFVTSMHRGHGDPKTTFVVGDSKWDVEAAKAASLPCIAVESGGFSEAELRDAGAISVYKDVDALRSQLRTSPLGPFLP